MELLPGKKIYEQASEAADFIQKQLSTPIKKPAIGVICGSGLGGLSDILAESRQDVHYTEIPYFPQSTGIKFSLSASCTLTIKSGRARRQTRHWNVWENERISSNDGGTSTVSLKDHGRMSLISYSFYEGHSIQSVVFPVRVLKLLGVETLIGTRESQRR
jgi:purine-nucleoside phosphorylase